MKRLQHTFYKWCYSLEYTCTFYFTKSCTCPQLSREPTIILPVSRVTDFVSFSHDSGGPFGRYSRWRPQEFHEGIYEGLASFAQDPVPDWTVNSCRIEWSPAEVWSAGGRLQLDTSCFSGQFLQTSFFKLFLQILDVLTPEICSLWFRDLQ